MTRTRAVLKYANSRVMSKRSRWVLLKLVSGSSMHPSTMFENLLKLSCPIHATNVKINKQWFVIKNKITKIFDKTKDRILKISPGTKRFEISQDVFYREKCWNVFSSGSLCYAFVNADLAKRVIWTQIFSDTNMLLPICCIDEIVEFMIDLPI